MEGIIEGLLYVSGDEGLTLKEISSILEIDDIKAKELVYKLKQEYENKNRGLRIKYLGNKFKITTKEEHKKYYEKLLINEKKQELSQQALEVLAIIAYNEPVTRTVIDEIRGVDSIYVIRKLLAKGLIKEAGKSDTPGRPILYKTTNDFLDYFGLASKKDLPEITTIEEENEEKDLFKSNYKE